MFLCSRFLSGGGQNGFYLSSFVLSKFHLKALFSADNFLFSHFMPYMLIM